MREIKGIICIAKSISPIKQERLFGPNTKRQEFNHQTFTSNGLVPFDYMSAAQEALLQLETRRSALDLTRIGLGYVKMEITSSDDEIELIRSRNNLIIIAELDFGHILLGRKVANVPGVAYAPVSNLELNGFKVIRNYEQAGTHIFGALYEVRRQGHPLSSYLATFKFKRLKRI